MSFRCDKCGTPGYKPVKVVTETRYVEYPERKYRKHGKDIVDPGGNGQEIVHEGSYCSSNCAVSKTSS